MAGLLTPQSMQIIERCVCKCSNIYNFVCVYMQIRETVKVDKFEDFTAVTSLAHITTTNQQNESEFIKSIKKIDFYKKDKTKKNQ